MCRVEFSSLEQMFDALNVRSLIENDKTIQHIKQEQQEARKEFNDKISDPNLSQKEKLKYKCAWSNAISIMEVYYRKRVVEILTQKFKNTFFFI